MKEWIAERKLTYTLKGDSNKNELTIRIGKPYLLEEGKVNFPIHEGAAGCSVEFDGLDDGYLDEVYGADSIQALQLAADVEPILKRYSEKYDFYFPTGEPYFEDEEENT